MDETTMKEDGDDEAEPLIGRRLGCERRRTLLVGVWVAYGDAIRGSKATQFSQSAGLLIDVCRIGRIWAEECGCRHILYANLVAHTSNISRAHVDEQVVVRPQHWVL